MKIRIADPEDLDKLYEFYKEVILHQKEDQYSANWTLDVYPAREDLEGHLENDRYCIMEEDGEIIGAACVCYHEDEIYKDVKWTVPCKDDEVMVIHLLAVSPEYRGRGLSYELLKKIIEDGRNTSKAIHLDVVKGNLPAFELYKKAGFHYIGEEEIFYEDTGRIFFDLMEYIY